jgi:predicted dehydrogenase
MYAYAEYAKMNPAMLKIAAVAEPDEAKRETIRREHRIPGELAFRSWEDAFENLAPVEAVIIATQDQMHAGPLERGMEKNLHILCEKPIVPSLEECRRIEKASAPFSRVFMIAHVLKYTGFFSTIKALLAEGRIGHLIGMDLIEHVGHLHYSHSFTRGHWRNRAESSPMILAKSCHDMDMLRWLAGAPCESLSSYGDLYFFKKENAPPGAPKRCLEGCPHMTGCPWFAPKLYLTPSTGWPTNTISTDLSLEGRLKALETGPYGRCVFHCDNDVVDHQTVSLRFTNGVTANFIMSGFTQEIHRRIALFGTGGEITGDMEEGRITIQDFSTRNREEIEVGKTPGGHSGGDAHFITDFVRLVREGTGEGRNMLKDSFESHYMSLAAEASRLAGAATLHLADFRSKGSS